MTAIQPNIVKADFMQDVGDFFKAVGNGVKEGALWCGKTIQRITSDYIVPAMKVVWNTFVAAMQKVWEFLQTPLGWATAGLVGCASLGTSLLAAAESENLAGSHHSVTRIMLRTFAASSFVAAGLIGGAGITLTLV